MTLHAQSMSDIDQVMCHTASFLFKYTFSYFALFFLFVGIFSNLKDMLLPLDLLWYQNEWCRVIMSVYEINVVLFFVTITICIAQF